MRNDYVTDYLMHSSGPWKKHKYIKKVGSRYYYKTDYTDNPGVDDSKTDYKITTPYSDKSRINIHEQHYVDLKDTTRHTGDYERVSNLRDQFYEQKKGYQINRKTVHYRDARTNRRVSKLSVNMHASVNSIKKKARQIQNGINAVNKRLSTGLSALLGRKTGIKEYRSMRPRKLPPKSYRSTQPRKLPPKTYRSMQPRKLT